MDRPRHVLANALWYLFCVPDSLAFRLAARDVARAQRSVLLRLLRRNAETEYGRRHGFQGIRSVADFRARVPLSTYDDYQPAVAHIAAGQAGVLTREPVLLLEPTSGSSAPSKLIPYTAALQAEFQRAVAPWIEDLYRHLPGLLLGQAYWSVTPVVRQNERTPGGLPVGFADDSEYLGPLERALLRTVLAVPPLVRLIDDLEVFRYVTLLFLVRSRSLAIISVWNPTFLSLLVDRLPDWWPRLAADVESGAISAPGPIPPRLLEQLQALNRPDRRRAGEIRTAFQRGGPAGSVHSRLWPRLRLISCWADAAAARYAAELARLFPQALIQGKGLLATEAVASFPLLARSGAALAIRSHFFEFLPAEGGSPALAHEVRRGQRYSLVVTTGGGLYRYRLHDLVEVTGHLQGCPLIRFVGKEVHISDRFGEKVSEQHVQAALDDLLTRYALRPTFAMLACEEELGWPAYTLFIEASDRPDELLLALSRDLEAALLENYHYRYCRDLGQLDRLRVFRVENGGRETYLAVCRARGQRAGDVKPVALDPLGGWARAFRGRTIEPAARQEGD